VPDLPDAVEHADRFQHSANGVLVEVDVLRREYIDRGGDDDDALAIEPFPGERLTREHVGLGALDVGQEKLPGLAGDGSLGVSSPT